MSTTSQVIVNVDTKLKNLAMKKAKSLGMPLSVVLNILIKAFVDGEISIGLREELNEKTRRHMEKARRDFKAGKNISPVFESVAQMRKWVEDNS